VVLADKGLSVWPGFLSFLQLEVQRVHRCWLPLICRSARYSRISDHWSCFDLLTHRLAFTRTPFTWKLEHEKPRKIAKFTFVEWWLSMVWILQPRSQGFLSCFEKEPWLRLVTWLPKSGNCRYDKRYSVGAREEFAASFIISWWMVFEKVNNTQNNSTAWCKLLM